MKFCPLLLKNKRALAFLIFLLVVGTDSESVANVFISQFLSLIPKVGQEFGSHEDVYSFYNQYAREAGSSTR